MISKDASFFSGGGCKYTPFLQQELGTIAFRPPLEMHLQGPPLKIGLIFRGGWFRHPPLEICPIFRGGRKHQPPLENFF